MSAVGLPPVTLRNTIRRQIECSIATKQAMLADVAMLSQIESLAGLCLVAIRGGGKVIFAGNGGSFADAQHLSAEFTSRLSFDRAPLRSLALGTNSSAMTAIGNDYGYDEVFARELSAIGSSDDVFIPISTSGNSPNILAAVAAATRLNIPVVAFTGSTGGRLHDLCDCIRIPSDDAARVQESHILVGHVVCGLVEMNYFAQSDSR